MLVTGFVSQLACLLNPYQVKQVLQQIAGNRRLQELERATGDDGTGYRTKARYSLPFSGRWLVAGGGTTPSTSHSWEILGQRFALDFVQADSALKRHSGSGTKPQEYRCYGADILAAADGVVSGIENGVGASPLLGWAIRDFTARHFVGNHVVIEHAEGEFALYAHLIKGSITVLPGERVSRGQVIGRCGHSGHSSEPHLHFHLQDSGDLWNGMGLPVQFHDLIVNGTPLDRLQLTAGQWVEPHAGATPPKE